MQVSNEYDRQDGLETSRGGGVNFKVMRGSLLTATGFQPEAHFAILLWDRSGLLGVCLGWVGGGY